MPQARDRVLFERWLERRDGDAFAELARRHSGVVFDLAARALGERSEAEDVLQEALLDLALATNRKPIEVGIAAWLVRFAVCRARNRRSSKQSRERRQRIVGARRAEEVMPDDTFELSDELEHVLARAEPEERLVLAMRYLHGWNYTRIASALSVSEGAARVRVHRALGSVRNRVTTTRPRDERRVRSALAALPLIALDGARFDGLIQGVIASAQAQLGPGTATVGGTTPAAPASRFASLAIKVGAVLSLALGLTVPLAVGSDRLLQDRVEISTGFVEAVPLDAVVDAAGGPVEATLPAYGGAPRPGDWDRGRLERLGRGERELDSVGAHVRTPADRSTPVEPATPPPAGQEPRAEPGLSKTSRPTSRGACAARCATASSDDERAGVSESPSEAASERASAARAAPVLAETASPVATNPGATAQTVPANYAISRPDQLGDPGTRVADLPPEQRELVYQAAALVEILADDPVEIDPGLDPLARSQMTFRRARRKANRRYRHARRALRQAALDNDVARVEAIAYEAQKFSTISTVLSLLVEASTPGAAPLDELRWPDGLDVEATLTNVVAVLSTPLPPGRGPDLLGDVVVGTQDDAAGLDERLPDALLEGF